MYHRCFDTSRFDKNTFLRAGICLVWIAGLSLGFCAARSYGDTYEAYILQAPDSLPSFFGVLSVNVLPLLISACAVFFFRSISFVLCLLRGILLGLGLGVIAVSYGGAGFLMSGSLLFSLLASTPVFFWYLCRRLEHGIRSFRRDTVICLLTGLVLSLLDIWVVSPFLREIMNF